MKNEAPKPETSAPPRASRQRRTPFVGYAQERDKPPRARPWEARVYRGERQDRYIARCASPDEAQRVAARFLDVEAAAPCASERALRRSARRLAEDERSGQSAFALSDGWPLPDVEAP